MRARHRTLVLVLGCSTLLGACIRQPTAAPEDGPPKELGERAVFVTTTTTVAPDRSTPTDSTGAANPTTTTAAGGRAAGSGTTTTAPPTRSGSASTQAPTPAKPLAGSVTDNPADNGLEAPDYADVASVALEDTGSDLRATVTFAAGLPRTLAEGEVMGVGVNLFRTNERESDYQLFATGRADGWVAYVDTPDGFVQYPGTFTVAGTALVFTVPWSSVGGHVAGTFSTFADWSKATVALVAREGQDSAPDQGTAPLA